MRVPTTSEAALDPAWLSEALAAPVVAVEQIEHIRSMATKIRFRATMADGEVRALCLKGFLDLDDAIIRGGGATTVREADFYTLIAPTVDVRVPHLVASTVDRDAQLGVIIMRDLIAEGAHFCSALEPFTVDDVAASLSLIAHLHADGHLTAQRSWITPRLPRMVTHPILPVETLQDLLDGPRSAGLAADTANAARIMAAVSALAERDATRPDVMVHGDSHAGNIYRTTDGPGLIDWQLLQRGGWALDVAYHVAAVLPVELAEREERNLLRQYLAEAGALGCALPDAEQAWTEYCEALVYGLYLWSVTRMVDPPVVNQFVGRLGRAVERCASFEVLGV